MFKFNKYKFWQCQGSSVIRFWVCHPVLDYQQEKEIFLFCKANMLAVGPPSLLFCWYRGFFPQGLLIEDTFSWEVMLHQWHQWGIRSHSFEQCLRVSKCYRTLHRLRTLGSSHHVMQRHNWDKQNLRWHHCKNPRSHICMLSSSFSQYHCTGVHCECLWGVVVQLH